MSSAGTALLRPGLNDSVPEIRADLVRKGTPSYTGKGVIVGIVDSGIDIFHRSFRTPDAARTTRLLALWDQILTPAQAPSLGPPAGFSRGIEFLPAALNAALAGSPDTFPHKDVSGHGTWVAGIAAGNGAQAGRCHFANTYIGVAPGAELVVVSLPRDPTTQEALAHPSDIIDGVRYIFGKAGTRPVVVNVSMEIHPSLHFPDTVADLEKGLDDLLVGTTSRSIVTIAGNYGDARDHFYGAIPANGTLTRKFFLGPVPRPALTGHLRYEGAGKLEITLVSKNRTFGPHAIGGTSVHDGVANDDELVLLKQTGNHHQLDIRPWQAGLGTRGGWTLTLHETAGAPVTVDFWAEIGAMKFFYGPDPSNVEPQDPGARQALADDHTRTLAAPGSAKHVITVGAHNISDGTLCAFSGRGPAFFPTGRQTPDVTAPGIGIVAPKSGKRGVSFCCDWWCNFYNVSGEEVGLDVAGGTSFAAPHVTGVVALMLERNRSQTFDQIRQRIQQSARNPGLPSRPDNAWGWGKVDALQAVTATPLPAGGGPIGAPPNQFMEEPVVLPFAAETATYWPSPSRLRDMLQRFGQTPTGQLVAALVSTHFDEVLRLIDTNRQIATLWHRLDAAALLRAVAALLHGDTPPGSPPPAVNSECLRRLFDRLMRYGSPGLRTDVAAHRALVLTLLGADLSASAPV